MVYLLAIALSMVVWLATPVDVAAAGNTYHVAKTGSDSNACSSSAPCLTIVKGTTKLSAGDTLVVHGGTYDEAVGEPSRGNPLIRAGTSWSNPVTIKSAPSETVIVSRFTISGPYTILDGGAKRGLIVDGRNYWETAISLGDNHIRIQNVEVRNGKYHGMLGCTGGYCEFINLHVHDNSPTTCFGDGLCHGLYTSGPGHLIDGGLWHDQHNGYALHFYPDPSNITVRNARIYNNTANTYGGGMFSRNNVLVYNNIFYNNTLSIWHRGSNGRFYNNTIYNSPQFGIQVDSGNDIRNNIVYNASIAQTGSGNTLSNNLTTNPSFVNAGSGDFHLQAGSPAIDAGVTVSEVTTDFDKRSRPQGARFAIGAYEYAGSAPPPLSAPTKRRVSGQ